MTRRLQWWERPVPFAVAMMTLVALFDTRRDDFWQQSNIRPYDEITNLLQQRNVFRAIHPDILPKIVVFVLPNVTTCIRDSIQQFVMDDHQSSITSNLDITFYVVYAEFDGPEEGRHRILLGEATGASVAYPDHVLNYPYASAERGLTFHRRRKLGGL